MKNTIKINTIDEILSDIKKGKMVIIVDDPSRENEGDLIFAAENVTPGKERQVKCLVRRNPDSLIFAGTYELNVKTNLGERTTTLQVITK